MHAIGQRPYELHFRRPSLASREVILQLLDETAGEVHSHQFTRHFLMTEWRNPYAKTQRMKDYVTLHLGLLNISATGKTMQWA
jgi:hypothetical protein